MADSGWGCKSNGANPRWGCKSNFDGAVNPMGRCVHTNWGAQYRGAVSPASVLATGRSGVRIPLRKTFRFGTLAIPFTPLCQCLSEETLKAVGPFYLVSMPLPGEVKDPTSHHWAVPCSGKPTSQF